MNIIIEAVILIIIIFYFVSGLRRGLIRQVLDVIGIIAAFIGAFYFAGHLATYFNQRFDVPHTAALIVAAIIIFIAILLLFNLLGISFQKVSQVTLLNPLDRIAGGIFGAFKGVLLVSLFLVILLNIPLPGKFRNELRRDPLVTAIYPVLPRVFDFILSRAPVRLDYWSARVKEIKEATNRIEDVEGRLEEGQRGTAS